MTMTTARQVTLPTDWFGRWLRRAVGTAPPPLSSGHAGRVRLSDAELEDLLQERVRVTNALHERMPAGSRELLDLAREVLAAPQLVVFAARVPSRGEQVTAAGYVAGGQALLVVDAPQEVTLRQVPPEELARAVIEAMPPIRPARIESVDLSEATLTAFRDGIGARGLDERGQAAARRARVPEGTARWLARASTSAVASGFIGALRLDREVEQADAAGWDWVEGTDGAVLKTVRGDGTTRYEPATRSVLIGAAVAAVAAAR